MEIFNSPQFSTPPGYWTIRELDAMRLLESGELTSICVWTLDNVTSRRPIFLIVWCRNNETGDGASDMRHEASGNDTLLWTFLSLSSYGSDLQELFSQTVSTILALSWFSLKAYFIWETVPRREYFVLFIKLCVDFPGLRCHSLMVVTRLGISSRFLDLIRFNWKYFLCLTAGLHLCELLSRNCCLLGRCHNPTHKLWQHCHL